MQLRRLELVRSQSRIAASLPITIYLFLLNFEMEEFASLLAIRICKTNEQGEFYQIQYQKNNFVWDLDHFWFLEFGVRLRSIYLTIKRFKRPSFLSTKEKSPLIYNKNAENRNAENQNAECRKQECRKTGISCIYLMIDYNVFVGIYTNYSKLISY